MGENGNRQHRRGLRLQVALMHSSRMAILDYLATDRVGIGEDELAAALGLSVPQVEYHLEVLDRAHLITQVDKEWTRRAGGRFYVAVA